MQTKQQHSKQTPKHANQPIEAKQTNNKHSIPQKQTTTRAQLITNNSNQQQTATPTQPTNVQTKQLPIANQHK